MLCSQASSWADSQQHKAGTQIWNFLIQLVGSHFTGEACCQTCKKDRLQFPTIGRNPSDLVHKQQTHSALLIVRLRVCFELAWRNLYSSSCRMRRSLFVLLLEHVKRQWNGMDVLSRVWTLLPHTKNDLTYVVTKVGMTDKICIRYLRTTGWKWRISTPHLSCHVCMGSSLVLTHCFVVRYLLFKEQGTTPSFLGKSEDLLRPFFFHLNISILSFINPAADMLDRGKEAHHLIGRASGRPKMDALSRR